MQSTKTNQFKTVKNSLAIANGSGNELSFIQQGDLELYDARLLHHQLSSGYQFSNWIQTRIKDYGFEEGKDFYKNFSKSSGGRKATEYYITIDMAKELAMLERTDLGRQIRKAFIEAEKKARGVTHLPTERQLLKGLKSQRISDRTMYSYKEILERCSYSTRSSSSSRKAKYWMHFVKFGNKLYITEEFALQLYKQRQVISNRAALVAMQPVLPLSFYNLEKGGAQ